MTATEILTLLSAGYTKEEIAALNTPDQEQDAAGDQEPAAGDPAAGDAGADSQEPGEIDQLKTAIAELTKTVKALQGANAKKAEGGKPGPERMTAEDAIKGFFGVGQAKK